MNLHQFEIEITRFLNSPEPEVIAIRGPWGGGKTFTWNYIFKKNHKSISLDQYAYVSLFSVSSIDDLKVSILTNSNSIEEYDTNIWGLLCEFKFKAIRRRLSGKGSLLASKLKDADIPYFKALNIGLGSLALTMVENTIICFDDFERISKKVSADEILGLISYLKIEKKCKIVLIFNEEQLGENKVIYDKYKEKVIDQELDFSPTAAEAAEVGLSSITLKPLITPFLVQMDISNIRVIQKIERILSKIFPLLTDAHTEVQRQTIHTITAGLAMHLSGGKEIPSLEFMDKWDYIVYAMRKDKSPDEEKWEALLNSWEFQTVDNYDRALFNVIRSGYIDRAALLDEVENLGVSHKSNQARSDFSKAWRKYHDSFANNEDDFIDSLVSSFRAGITLFSTSDLHASVSKLRELSRDDLADALIDEYIQNNQQPEILALNNSPWRSDITDKSMNQKFDKALTIIAPQKTLPEIMDEFINGYIDQQFIPILRGSSEEDFYNEFKKEFGERDMGRIIKTLIQTENNAALADIGKKVRGALNKIAGESLINASRIKYYQPPA